LNGFQRPEKQKLLQEARLIVHELDGGPIDLLCLVLRLLHLKDVLVKVLLQLFVSEVDAELFEVIDLELLEPVDVENSDNRRRILYVTDREIDLHTSILYIENNPSNNKEIGH
jgi:hypothetical protein